MLTIIGLGFVVLGITIWETGRIADRKRVLRRLAIERSVS